MNKGMKIFLKVFYYAFGIVAGILLAIVVPQALYYDMPFEYAQKAIDEKDFAGAIRFYGGYFDSDYVYQKDDDKAGIVIFATATLEPDDQGTEGAKIKKAYSGFIYSLKNKDGFTYSDGGLKPTVKATSKDSKIYEYNIINCDSDSDDVNDSVYTLINYNFIFFSFRTEDISDISSLTLVNNINETVYSLEGLNLEFKEQFFTDVTDFVNEYNNDYSSSKLSELDTEFRSRDDSYKMSYYDDIKKKVNTKGCIIVLVYFACIYIIGDCLVGKRYIIHGIKKLIKKLNKKFGKKKNEETKEPLIGDYYTQVTYQLIVPNDCNESFLITYSNEQNTIEFALTKQENYKVTKRIHAGVYVNAWVEVEGYQAIDFPKTIEVKGFTRTFTATFTHKQNTQNKNIEVK